MASIHVAFGSPMASGAPVHPRKPRRSETVTSSGTSARTTGTAQGGDFAFVTAIDGAVYVEIGPSATATSSSSWAVPSGGSKEFGPLKDGDQVAVIDV